MNPNIPSSQKCAIVGRIDPDATGASTVLTGWIAANTFKNFMAILMAGTLGVGATIDAKLRQATDSSGTGAKDIDGKAITQLTQAGVDDSDKDVVIELRPGELDIANGFTHFALSVTVATAACDMGALVLGLDPSDGFASDSDAASVDEIVS